MADFGAARLLPLYHTPGNPEFPVLPDGVTSIHLLEVGKVPGLRDRADVDEILAKFRSSGPGRFSDWYTDQIWRSPNPVDFGNITAPKTRFVTLTNTNRTSVQLTAVDVSAIPGLSVISPGLPITIEAFDSVVVEFEVVVAGDPAFDELVIFTVGALALTIRMLGRRVIIFNTLPQRPIVERLSWLTDNMIARDGTEQAFSLRAAPRVRVATHQRFTDDVERTRQQTLFSGAGFLRMGVQLWWQARQVTVAATAVDTIIQVDTANMEIEVERDVSFVTPAGVAVEGEVQAFDASSITLSQAVGIILPLGTNVMPLQFGFQSNKVDLATFPTVVEDVKNSFDLIEYSDIGALDMAYFDTHPTDGLPIITHPSFIAGQSRRATIRQDIQRIDGQTGDVGLFREELIARHNQDILVHCNSLADQHAWRQFLHFVRGSWGKFYVPTRTNDLPLDVDLSLGGNTFTIPSMGIESLLQNHAPRRDLWIDVAGVVYHRRITSVSDNGVIELVTVDGVIPGGGTVPKENVRVSWLTLARISGDTATFRHKYTGVAELRFRIRGVIEA